MYVNNLRSTASIDGSREDVGQPRCNLKSTPPARKSVLCYSAVYENLDGLRASRRSAVRPKSRLLAVDGQPGNYLLVRRISTGKRACGKRRTAFPRFNQVKSLSPHHRFVIALHSPVKVTETGLRMCCPEKGRQIDAIRSRAVRSLQSALRTKYYEIRASLRISQQKAGQFLCGLDLLAERPVPR